MCKKLNKHVELKIIGDETQVDKNIIEHISDPLMHLVRNSLITE
jgi:two-component system chemotaxis sensor kinase CheA